MADLDARRARLLDALSTIEELRRVIRRVTISREDLDDLILMADGILAVLANVALTDRPAARAAAASRRRPHPHLRLVPTPAG